MPEITYVGWGGRLAVVQADQPLGYGSRRGYPRYGLRRAVWDACCGFVNGFTLPAIAYFVITRSLHRGLHLWFMRREGWEIRDGRVVVDSNPRRRTEWAEYIESKGHSHADA